jgi:3-hydroxyisobutyrate dehydrogenase-like beta-hydroxyacid dehydrogenase
MNPNADETIMAAAEIRRAGVIGLGAMGLQMARHMAAKGFDVAGTDIDNEAMERAAAHGVRLCGSAAEVGAHAEVVIVMVATDAQVDGLVRASGLLDALAPGAGSVIAVASSVAPETCRDLAGLAGARGIGLIDTPVVLGQEAANNATLTVYAGGEERWVALAKPVLAAFAAKIIHVGAVGNGQIAKNVREFRGADAGKSARRRRAEADRGPGARQRRQLVAVALGQRHRQMGRKGHGRGA